MLALLSKLSVYGGLASVAGGSLFLVLYSDNRRQTVIPVLNYCFLGALIGFQGAALNFPFQIGMINDSGLKGLFDWPMAKLLLDTQLGDVTLYRLLGFAVAIAASAYFLARAKRLVSAPSEQFFRPFFTISSLVLICIVLSFPATGHVSVLSDWVKFALSLHVAAFASWIGLLWPFMVLARTPNLILLQQKLAAFGRHASVILIVLIATGAAMVWQLVGSLNEMYTSYYGLGLSLKVLIFIIILVIATWNKFRLVPKIQEAGVAAKFRHSVTLELSVAVAILCLTAAISTILGPGQH